MANPHDIPMSHFNDRRRRFSHPYRVGNAVPKDILATSSRRKHSMPDGPRGSFMLQLMAIDERHDKRMKEREIQIARRKSESRDTLIAISPDLGFLEESKVHSRWTAQQILNDYNDTKPALVRSSQQTTTRLPPLPEANTLSKFFLSDGDEVDPSVLYNKLKQHRKSSVTDDVLRPDLDQDLTEEDNSSEIPSNSFRNKPLRLPPLLLPPIYSVQPQPLRQREFLPPTQVRGPIEDSEWEELFNCRYIRPAPTRLTLQLNPLETNHSTR